MARWKLAITRLPLVDVRNTHIHTLYERVYHLVYRKNTTLSRVLPRSMPFSRIVWCVYTWNYGGIFGYVHLQTGIVITHGWWLLRLWWMLAISSLHLDISAAGIVNQSVVGISKHKRTCATISAWIVVLPSQKGVHWYQKVNDDLSYLKKPLRMTLYNIPPLSNIHNP